eukprot:TRINITY_DN193_c0_g1_i4.p1 TRINITY_DN193_c0_g1~~TRINITY_DN193_c0_g1_i4.p1  ORF type:complete len:532 (+),score=148.65 TRINITY_DN193_c0_g1_i4:1459-3054(+)
MKPTSNNVINMTDSTPSVGEEGKDGDDGEEIDEAEECEDEDADEIALESSFVGVFDASNDDSLQSSTPAKNVLTARDIAQEQQKVIGDVSEVLSVDRATAGALLRHFRWRKDLLLTAYLEDPVKVCKQVGAPLRTEEAAPFAGELPGSSEAECTICGDEFELLPNSCLSCKHMFCPNCWESFLTVKIQEGQCSITCPAQRCNMAVSEDFVLAHVPPELYKKYMNFFTNSFVENNPEVKWCPAPGCGNAVTSDNHVRGVGICTCGYKFCWECLEEAHPPASCFELKNWKKKCLDDSETQHWIMTNTQGCPKCKSVIEKNGGCNHMICRQCKYEFCWVCRGEWRGHSNFYSCNRYEATKKKNSRKKSHREHEQELIESKLALEKYLHYYQRYLNHEKSMKFEAQLKQHAQQRMLELRETDDEFHDVYFIQEATDVLLGCRNVLKNSYVYSYYMPEGVNTRNLFELLQSDLEKCTEQLSELLERPSDKMNRIETKNVSNLCALRVKNMLDAVDSGFSTSPAADGTTSANATSAL